MKRAILTCILAIAIIAIPASAKYSGGTGEPNTPYQIADANDLLTLSADADDHDLSFILIADINLADHNFTESVIPYFAGNFNGNNYTISNISIFFNHHALINTGFFGGISYAVVENLNLENIDVNSTSIMTSYTGGLAGIISYSTISNCTVTGSVFSKGYYAGGLIGQSGNNNQINNCSFQGSVANHGYYNSGAGGLVGTNRSNTSSITNCFTECYVESSYRAGGIVASNYGPILNCFTIADINALTDKTVYVGGFAGKSSGKITNSGCIANIIAADTADVVGGFIGVNFFNEYNTPSGIIKNCYCQTTITGNRILQTGGFVGNNGSNGLAPTDPNQARGNCFIENCYSATTITLNDYTTNAGGFAGANFDSQITNCFWDQDIMSTQINQSIAFDVNSTIENIVALDTAQMKTQSSYTGWDFINTLSDGYHNYWFMPESDYPILSWQHCEAVLVPDLTGMTIAQAQQKLADVGLSTRLKYIPCLSIPAGQIMEYFYFDDSYALQGGFIELYISAGNPGDGSEANPYLILSPQDLEYLTTNTSLYDKSFILGRDINLDGRQYDAAIINPVASGEPNTPFAGTFDGDGYTIRNLTFNVGDRNNYAIALFSTTAEQAIIKNITLDNVTINKTSNSDATYIAALVGDNKGTVTGCNIKTIIDTEELSNIGGLCGKNSGPINNCFADTTITSSKDYVGGLIGQNYGNVNDCSTQVNINALWLAGGLIGQNNNSTIQTCYTTGNITCQESETGGLIGSQSDSDILNCYSTCTISANRSAGGIVGSANFSTIENCYFAGSASGNENIGGILGTQGRTSTITSSFFLQGSSPDNGLGDELTDGQMKTQTSFTDWDFINDNNGSDDVWFMAAGGYPKLTSHALSTDLYIDGVVNMWQQ